MFNNGLDDVFKALSHETRRQILDLLKDGPKTTGELTDHFPEVSRYAVMKHLSILEEAKLLLIRRKGRTRLNYLNAVPLQALYERWVSQYQGKNALSLLTLKDTLEGSMMDMNESTGLKHGTFQIEQEVEINAPKDIVFDSLTRHIDKWWAYRLCGAESNLSIDPKAGGKFIEKGKGGNAALWGTITYFDPNNEIRLEGLLGMQGAVISAYGYRLETYGNLTLLKLSHQASGLLDPEWHQAHEEGWKELLGTFLKEFVEEGKTR
ncbi:metalloregulator ArsR/SmtB family transcription factor [Falsibacillus albus]|uniref:ArsR family transcriptional regulator n=1 Tax=Falsibacillus albus TaxID=2478915 RepID=A0A3L7JZ39_9BACI|nr:metalloregulator ArsR/SmtB family transcription factor [Falsibacillus albus]RLQ95544.1 ArsR family transcriptional regulator [Falsibacillus albus]